MSELPPLRFWNTLTRRKEDFRPRVAGRVGMYHCGPTVYQRPHIGNYRAFLFADLLRRVFEARGYAVEQVMNLTDVGHLVDDADQGEDKLEAQARREKLDPWAIVERVSAQFFEDLDALGVQPAHHYPRATDNIPQMVELVQILLDKGHAYRVGDNVYFDVHSFPAYGRLSGNKVAELEAGARLEVNDEKRHPADFALWKSDPQHIMKWATAFGEHGFPGWHIECSAMARRYLGDHLDIHTGGEDNVFPHHECEIAQSECALGGPFVSLWMHTKFLKVDGGKMSKSLGNVYSLDDLRERGFDPLDLRFFVMRAHYRGSLNFTWEALKGAAEARRSLIDFRGRLLAVMGTEVVRYSQADIPEPALGWRQSFWEALSDDLNTSKAVAVLFEMRKAFLDSPPEPTAVPYWDDLLVEADRVFGLFATPAEDGLSDAEVEALIGERKEARAAKDFARSDAIRDELAAAGIVLEDRADGVHWHRG